ncbi:MAG: competence/damage-inducible protein A, partial [Gammaproteobacteria bacterium]
MNSEPKNAGVVVIGNEILSGRTQDSNLSFIGGRLSALGIILREARVIPDVEATIISTVRQFSGDFDYVFTTGGIGPTHDDITTACVASAFNRKIIRDPEAVKAMDKYYEPGQLTEARLKMADVPEGATLVPNPVSA